MFQCDFTFVYCCFSVFVTEKALQQSHNWFRVKLQVEGCETWYINLKNDIGEI